MQRFASNRMEILAANLAAHLMADSGDPMEPEIVVVQSRGMERWLSMELARWSGVCANRLFLFPGSLMERCLLPPPGDEKSNAWEKAAMRWALYRILQRLPEDEDFQSFKQYTRQDPLRTFQLANLLAGVFDEYVLFRPERILAWEKGREKIPVGREGREERFQAKLWRLLKEEIVFPHRIDLLRSFNAQKNEDLSPFLPQRISIFGVSALPPLYLSFFEKLGKKALIRWYLLDPCREYWGDIFVQKVDIFSESPEEAPFADKNQAEEKAHPLLASLGKTGRDFFGGLSAMEGSEERFFVEPGKDSLLHRIQSGIGTLDSGEWNAFQNEPLSPSDDSVRIHACHGPMREMEVLKHELLRLFSGDNPPRAREILVMFPDIAAYAPYVEAVFGEPLPDGGRFSYRIADNNLLSENRIAPLFLKVLALLSSRFTASDVFDILEYPIVAGNFGLSRADLEEIRTWILDLRISWGLDGAFKELQGLPAMEDGTWKRGLDRMILGMAMEDRGVVGENFLPHDPMGPEKARVLAGFLDFMEKLTAFYEESGSPRSMRSWMALLGNFLGDFFEESLDTAEEFIAVRKIFESLSRETEAGGMEEALSFSVMRHVLAEAFTAQKSLSVFPGGGITFCAMVPMRCIPFSFICLCGMNGENFPRKDFRPVFDLMAREPKPGDRSRRDDDRYLFLETLLSARERFWITYTGFKAEDNTMLPPSVLVEELIHAAGADRGELIRNHPMQPFSPSLFMKKENGGPKSFSKENLAVAKAIRSQSGNAPFIFQDGSPQPAEREKKAIQLAELVSFFGNPAAFFLKRVPGIRPAREAVLFSDEELFSLNGLDRYRLREDFCDNALEKGEDSLVWKRLSLENRLPQGALGKIFVPALEGKALAGKIMALDAPVAPPGKPARLFLDDVFLEGEVPESGDGREVFRRAGEIRSKDLIAAWIHFLFRKALGMDTALYLAGMEKKKDAAFGVKVFSFSTELDAGNLLSDLLLIFFEGERDAIPLFPDFSREFVEKLHFAKQKSSAEAILEKMRKDWEEGKADTAAFFLWQGKNPFLPPFEEMAERVWLPLLKACKEVPAEK